MTIRLMPRDPNRTAKCCIFRNVWGAVMKYKANCAGVLAKQGWSSPGSYSLRWLWSPTPWWSDQGQLSITNGPLSLYSLLSRDILDKSLFSAIPGYLLDSSRVCIVVNK